MANQVDIVDHMLNKNDKNNGKFIGLAGGYNRYIYGGDVTSEATPQAAAAAVAAVVNDPAAGPPKPVVFVSTFSLVNKVISGTDVENADYNLVATEYDLVAQEIINYIDNSINNIDAINKYSKKSFSPFLNKNNTTIIFLSIIKSPKKIIDDKENDISIINYEIYKYCTNNGIIYISLEELKNDENFFDKDLHP
jgi:hypothetical protein